MNRRNFISKTGYTIGAGTLLSTIACSFTTSSAVDEWSEVRSQFLLDTSKNQMAQMLLASHPKKVRDAINKYRKALDDNPTEYWENNFIQKGQEVITAAGQYLNCKPGEIALTDSTTMGLATLYGGLKLKVGDEILTTTHDHYSTEKSLEFAARRNGATIKRVSLYADPAKISLDEVLNNLRSSISPATRIVAVTFVHSSTGVKLPLKEMATVIKEANKQRDGKDRIYFCVDAVHGFGIENITVGEIGVDFLAAGTHKWLFGPRGTGILWAKEDAWGMVEPTIPPFSIAYAMWMKTMPEGPLDFYSKITPGGFHSFEYRWALKEAFEFHMDVGKEKIEQRTHALGTMLKEGIKNIKHIKLHTPVSEKLSSGINCFEVNGMAPDKVIEKLHARNIIGSTTPYRTVYARLTPCVINTEEEVKQCIKALEEIKA